MKNLPIALILEKNKLATANPWLVTLDVTFPAPYTTPIYLVANTEDIDFGGNTYTAFPFKLDVLDGDNPTLKLMLSNVTRVLQAYLEELDGAVGATVLLRWINAAYLTEDYAELELEFEVLESIADAQWVTFTLGTDNLLRSNFPEYRYLAGHCNWVRNYKGVECAYDGALTTCLGTLDDCRLHINLDGSINATRYGGFPGLSGGGVRFA